MAYSVTSNPSVDWRVFDDDLQGRSEWEAAVAAEEERNAPSASEQGATVEQLRRFYEFVIIIASAAAVVIFAVWWQMVQRVDLLEGEMDSLRSELAALSARPGAGATGDGAQAEEQIIETEFLRFDPGDLPAHRLASVVSAASQRYGKLRRDLGLGATPVQGKLSVQIARSRDETTQDPSTLLLPLSALGGRGHELAVADALANALAYELPRRTMAEALAQRDIQPQWQPLVRSLEFFLMREQGFLPSWRSQPYYVARRHLAQTQSLAAALQLEGPRTATSNDWNELAAIRADQVSDTLVEFIVAEYGYRVLPDLLDGFEQYDDWETLSPALFQMPATDFQAAWHAFLQETYPR